MQKSIITLLTLAALLPANAANYLDRSQWKWSASSICAPEDSEIVGLQGIYDGDISTCWHSNWHAEAGTPERSNPHWVMIDRGADKSEFAALAYTPRQSTANTACTLYYIYLSDTDLSDTPATSAADIISRLGQPDLQGAWDASTDEKFANLDKPSTARYILFVNVTSANSSSAACAEMNLCTNNSYNPGTEPKNAIRITPAGSTQAHRIAINGDELTMSMSYGYIRMSNSNITIEYAPAEVDRFSFEYYDFGNTAYDGPKKDVLTETFGLTVTPAPGKVKTLSEVTLSSGAGSIRVNPAVNTPVNISGPDGTLFEINPDGLDSIATANGYLMAGFEAKKPGTYTLTVPEALLIEPDGARSASLRAEWVLEGPESGISAPEADCPTITLSHSGGTLTVGGITGSRTVTLVNTSGVTLLTAPVDSNGTARLNVGSLASGIYLLTVNSTTLKIIL